MTPIQITNDEVLSYTQDILRQMQIDNWKPDYIVGLTRGGLIPAVYMSQYLDCPLETLKVSVSTGKLESNLWMAEDAWGYGGTYNNTPIYDEYKQKKILIVDDINDTGTTLNWIINDWQSSCLPNSTKWDSIWGDSVRFAVLVDNTASNFTGTINYTSKEINKAEDPSWIIFPWENWWLK
jgi:xanthine phosphoribosyltransferase